MYPFNYHRPQSADDALALFKAAEDGIYLAGGQTLLPTMKQRLAAPTDLIDLCNVPDLRGIELETQAVSVGALTLHSEVAGHEGIRSALPVLSSLAGEIGDSQVRNRGTLGGSLPTVIPPPTIPLPLLAWARPFTLWIAASRVTTSSKIFLKQR